MLLCVNVSAILIDLGGTLVVTPSLPETVRELAAHPLHKYFSLDSERSALLGRVIQEEIWAHASRTHDKQLHWIQAWQYGLKRVGLPYSQTLAIVLNETHIRAMHRRARLYAYTIALLDLFHRRAIPVCLVSNVTGPPHIFDDLLRQYRLLHLFHSRVWSSAVHFRKPHVAVFQRALASVDLKPQDTIVMVGDDEAQDIQPANALGFTSVFVHHGSDTTAKTEASYSVCDSNILTFFGRFLSNRKRLSDCR